MELSRPRLRLPAPDDLLTRWQRTRAFFAFHGVWAPGVRLMRAWSFRAKLSLVMLMLGLPLLWAVGLLALERYEFVRTSEGRLAGAQLADDVYAFGGSFHDEWQALQSGRAAPVTDRSALLAQLEAAMAAARDSGLDVRAEWEAAIPVFQRAASETSIPAMARQELLGDTLLAVVSVQKRAVDVSGVMLTPDLALNAQATLAYEILPALQVDLARMRAQAAQHAVLAAREGVSATDLVSSLVLLGMRLEAAERQLELAGRKLALLDAAERGAAGSGAQPLGAARALVAAVRAAVAGERVPGIAELQAIGAAAREHVLALRLELSSSLRLTLEAQRAAASKNFAVLSTAVLLTLLAAAYAVYSLYLVMHGGLRQLHRQMELMAAGDLSARPVAHGNDEIGRSIVAMTRSLAGLSDLLASVRDGVSSVSQASQQVASGNAELQGRNRVAADGLQTLVAGVAAYTEQLQACGRQVEAVVGSVQQLRLQAARNRKQMVRLRERLAALQGKSREIGEIITLIDAIAFRTNILALNASVEASKAGESGRGFAVVAQEVRSLAMRSAESARKIGDIITRSTEDIALSGSLADEAGQSMRESDEHVDQIHAAMNDVASLTRSGEQESASILAEITQLKDNTSKNQQLVEQLAEASAALRSQGERLAHKVGQFRLS